MPVLPVLLFAAASYTVAQDAPLRSGCGTSDELVATVKRGDPVQIRFSMAGEGGTCYKVSVESEGKTHQGYLSGSALTGLEEYQRSVQTAAAVMDTPAAARKDLEALAQGPLVLQLNARNARAKVLLEAGQPDEALRELEQALRTDRRDASLLATAGLAAYEADRVPDAIRYWEESQGLVPNEGVARMLARAKREAAADQSSEKLFGSHFALRFNAREVNIDQARQLLPVLDREFARVGEQLGCRTEERITAVVQSPQSYRNATGAAEWSGGSYDGRIRVALFEPQPGEVTRRTIAHEIVHACLARLGDWPAWLHEGLAQKLSGEQMAVPQKEALRKVAAAGKLPSLSLLNASYSGLGADAAAAAYALSLQAVEVLYQGYGSDGVRSLLKSPERLPQITSDLDRRLREKQ